MYARIDRDAAAGRPLVVLVHVPLCDGVIINCGNASLGAPGNLRTNLYLATSEGILHAFREQYMQLFASFDRIETHVSHRPVWGEHIVKHECWSRQIKQSEVQNGDVLVRYTLRDSLFGYIEFLR